jgi:uncharacterized protein (TIGR02453 family)
VTEPFKNPPFGNPPFENPLSPSLFDFLRDLKQHNTRPWFEAQKARYEDEVKEPCFRFISDFGPELRKISRHFQAIPKAVGGSLFRIYRDTRFSKDKTPYKTHTGLHFRHEQARDAHAPGFYLHLEPEECFLGVGIWHPDSATLTSIRRHLAAEPAKWFQLLDSPSFKQRFELAGESLARPPRGFPADHPAVEDLKRKDFIAVARFSEAEVVAADFPSRFVAACQGGAPLVSYLCKAVGVPF